MKTIYSRRLLRHFHKNSLDCFDRNDIILKKNLTENFRSKSSFEMKFPWFSGIHGNNIESIHLLCEIVECEQIDE